MQRCADALEAAYAARTGQPHALAVNSCTAGLSVARTALGIGPGDEVLVPGFLWVSCLAAVVRAGAIPVLVEVDESFTMDPRDAAAKVTDRTRALLVVHMSGAAADMDALCALAEARGLLLVEDMAQANGAAYRGRPMGGFGDAAIVSLQYSKALTAGEGGVALFRDEDAAARAFAAHDLGYARGADGRVDWDDAATQGWGQGARMGELCAAMALAQEAKLDRVVTEMRGAAHALYDGLSGIAGARPRVRPDTGGENGSFVILTWPDEATCAAMTERTRALGVRDPQGSGHQTVASFGVHLYSENRSLVHRRPANPAGHPWTLPENAAHERLDYARGALPASDDFFARSSIMALSPGLGDAGLAAIIEAFGQAAAGLGA